MKKVHIKFSEYHYKCGDGCCDIFGTKTEVNGVEMDSHNMDTETILKNILEHLGYEVIIEGEYL